MLLIYGKSKDFFHSKTPGNLNLIKRKNGKRLNIFLSNKLSVLFMKKINKEKIT